MTRTRYSVVPPDTLVDIFRPIAVAEEETFALIVKEVRSSKAFSTDRKRCESLGDLLGMSPEDVAVLLSFLGNLYQRFRGMEKSGADFGLVVDAFVQEALQLEYEPVESGSNETNFVEVIGSRLKTLLAQSDSVDDFEKRSRLKRGFIKNAIAFSSFVDLRPDFRREFGTIHSFVPVIQFKITTDADDAGSREFVFQCDQSNLTKLKEVISEIDKKLLTISQDRILSAFSIVDEAE